MKYFKEYPDSNARLFVASKAGVRQLMCEYEGETILDLFIQLKDYMQFNTSVSIMPTEFRNILEPYAAPIEERLNAVRLCQKNGIRADSALIQPIFTPYLTDEHIKECFGMLHEAGIINYKPEFLTACMENLAMLGQWLGYYDKKLEKELYEDYIMPSNADHKKQRGRTAPDRALNMSNIEKMMRYTDSIGMSVSICYWVRKQLKIGNDIIPIINRNGFQCLGYQSELFNINDKNFPHVISETDKSLHPEELNTGMFLTRCIGIFQNTISTGISTGPWSSPRRGTGNYTESVLFSGSVFIFMPSITKSIFI